MHSSANFQAPPIFVVFYCSCDKVHHKKEVCFLLYLLGQTVTRQYNPNSIGLGCGTVHNMKLFLKIVTETSVIIGAVNFIKMRQ